MPSRQVNGGNSMDGGMWAAELGNWLVVQRLTIGTAESLTAGHLQVLISSISGSSRYFVGGVTAYNLRQKVRILHVDAAHAAEVNCVSLLVARQMAAGARRLFGTDLAVSTTGYAEPSPADQVAFPFAYYAIDGPFGVLDGRIDCPARSRTGVQRDVAVEVLRRLVAYLHAGDQARSAAGPAANPT